MGKIFNYLQFIIEKKKEKTEKKEKTDKTSVKKDSLPALKPGKITTDKASVKKDSLPALKPGKITTDKDIEIPKIESKNKKTPESENKKNSAPSTSGAISGDSDVRSPTSTRTEVRSPTSTETSTDAYTAGNITVTGGAGAGDTTVHIHTLPEDYKRLPSGQGRKKHMPSAVEQPGPNDPKSY